MTVGVCISLDNKRWEKDKDPKLVHSNVTASVLTMVGAKAV
jgi:hypothetical protein